MSKLFDIAAIILITAPAFRVQAGVSDAEPTTSFSSHRLNILNELSLNTEVPFEIYTATPDFNMVHSDELMNELSQANEFQALSTVNSLPQLLEQPTAMPSAFIERMSF